MAARTAREAIQPLLGALHLCLSCITEQPIQVVPSPADPLHHVVSFIPRGTDVTFVTFPRRTRLSVNFAFDLLVLRPEPAVRDYVAHISGYVVSVRREQIPREEIVVYHWHPQGKSRYRTPHLHVPTMFDSDDSPKLTKQPAVHFPTGFVPLADIVRMLIEEFGVEAQRPDWSSVLETNGSSLPYRSI